MSMIAKRLLSTVSTPYGRYPVLHPSMAMTVYPDIRHVPAHIPRPQYVPRNFFEAGWGDHDTPPEIPTPSQEEGRLDLKGMQGVREAGKIVADILGEAGKLVKPGTTTDEIDKAVHEMIIARGAYPSPLGYSSFPRSITTSVNNVIAHGIPDDRPLDPRDIINIDITIYYNGYHGDTSKTFVLPEVDNEGRELVEVTKEALERGIKVCGPGMPFSGIGRAIGDFVQKEGFSVNEQFSGHGIGAYFHQKPWVLHHLRRTRNGKEMMQPGDCFTIEPPIVQGKNSRGILWDDGWTMSTESGARSAQFEHQILVTEDGVEILTR